MKVTCGRCKTIFEYDDKNKVCPECKRFYSIPKDKLQKEEKINKEKEEIIKEKELKNKNSEKEKLKEAEDIAIDLNDIDDRRQRKYFYFILTCLLAIIILPISMRSDPSTKVTGPDGTIISTQETRLVLSEAFNELFFIRKIGYTNSGDLYVLYESNIYGFADLGYEIKFAVTNADGQYYELSCIGSDFLAQENDVQVTYFTKALFNYNKDMPRITKLHVTLNNRPLSVISF